MELTNGRLDSEKNLQYCPHCRKLTEQIPSSKDNSSYQSATGEKNNKVTVKRICLECHNERSEII